MPQRLRRPEPDPAVIELPGRVVCTDRGQHPRARVTAFADPGGAGSAESGMTAQMTPQWDVIADLRPDALTLRFFCRRCGRDVRLREATVLTAIDALRQASGSDHVVLDISALPC